jgi:acyl-CoA reductase-like NAD-dependent aldehyde dehydrogenase
MSLMFSPGFVATGQNQQELIRIIVKEKCKTIAQTQAEAIIKAVKKIECKIETL